MHLWFLKMILLTFCQLNTTDKTNINRQIDRGGFNITVAA